MSVLVSLDAPKLPDAVSIAVVNAPTSVNCLGVKGPIILYDVAMLAT